MKTVTLLPMPRQLTISEGMHRLGTGKRIVLSGAPARELLFSAERLAAALTATAKLEWSPAATAFGPPSEVGAQLVVDPLQVAQPQGYRLSITPDSIQVVGHDAAGLFYGVCTLIQVIEQSATTTPDGTPMTEILHPVHPPEGAPTRDDMPQMGSLAVPCLSITDYPDFATRGLMLDISRDKVPTLETLLALVDLLASWKINQLQLYMEHTFTYRRHPLVWAEASPLSEADILRLDAYCRRRYVELVPNQNSFGHMHRWLHHDPYRPLAEVPDYSEKKWWGHGPFSLCPLDPRSLQLLQELYDELLPNFSSRQFNVGADETFDLGTGRSKAECDRRGTGRVYLDFLLQIYRDVARRGYRMQFWGDIIVKHPELIPELPKDLIALEWGYEATHPFAERSAQFAHAGVPFYVCPGTSTWNTVAGRTDNALGNLRSAAEHGLAHGAVGYLNTDWGDNGHWQFLPVSYLGYAYGAGVSWCLEANRALDLPAALNAFAFRDPSGAMGRVAYELGNVYQSLGPYFRNASGLVRVLLMPHMHGEQALSEIRNMKGITPESFERALAAVGDAMAPIENQRMQRADAALVMDEFETAAGLLNHAAKFGQWALLSDPPAARAQQARLADELNELISNYRRLWLARNRPGGLKDSVVRLEKIAQVYQ
jgi:hypothetical protein